MKKLKLSEDERNLKISESLKIPYKNYWHDEGSLPIVCEGLLKLGYELNSYYCQKNKEFKTTIFAPHTGEIYCSTISGKTLFRSIMNAVFNRIESGISRH